MGESSAASKLDQGLIEHAKGRVKVISDPTDLAAVRNLLSDVNDASSAHTIEPQAKVPEMAGAFTELARRGIHVIPMSAVYDVIIMCDIGALDPRRSASPASCAAHANPVQQQAQPHSLPARSHSLAKPAAVQPDPPPSAHGESHASAAAVSQDFRRLISSTQLVSLHSRCEALDSAPGAGAHNGAEGVPDTQPRPAPRDPTGHAAAKAECQGEKRRLDPERDGPADPPPSKRARIGARAPEQEQSTAPSAAGRTAPAQAEAEAHAASGSRPRVERRPAAADPAQRVAALPAADSAGQAPAARAQRPAAAGKPGPDAPGPDVRSALRPHAQPGAFAQQPRPQWPTQRLPPPPLPPRPAAGESVGAVAHDADTGDDAMSGHATAGSGSESKRGAARAPPPEPERGGEVAVEGEWNCCTSQEALARTSGVPPLPRQPRADCELTRVCARRQRIRPWGPSAWRPAGPRRGQGGAGGGRRPT